MKTRYYTSNEELVHATYPVFYYQTLNSYAKGKNSDENETMNELQRQSLVRNDKIFFSLQRISSCFPTFLLIFVICFPKFRKLSKVSPNRSTVSSSGNSTPSANSDSLTLGFRERTKALHFSGFKIILLL